ncbi:helix-turn-helix domain-containing protein [Gordonibacter sp. 28C]|uniref:helix-turn-helix domain-containing protein n=1 Tax=Gordonibacter sp. 28C TaxID=2078569 RepID=UPI0018F45DFB|nr:AraC family transcriptional regulator [Gordonibacter sp. 28C]
MDDQVLAVQRMQDYLAAHVEDDVSTEDLAAVSLFSPWHSYRLFKRYTGMTPADYRRRLRLSRSAARLREEGLRVSDVAFESGFGSVDGYQRAFLREFGCNPGAYAAEPVPIGLFVPYGVKFEELRRAHEPASAGEERTVLVQVVEKPARRVVLKRGVRAFDYFSYGEEVGCEVWGLVTSMEQLGGEPVSLWLPPRYRPAGTSVYVQGAEMPADFEGPVPGGFDVVDLPAATYLAFQGEPFREEDFIGAVESVQRAMERYDPAVVGYAWDDDSPRVQYEPDPVAGYVEMRAVKRV